MNLENVWNISNIINLQIQQTTKSNRTEDKRQ